MDKCIGRLQREAAMASRLIARRAHSFRVQPSFAYFRKMNVALCRLQEVSVRNEIDSMKDAIKSSCQIDDAYHLPTAANFRYFLIRLQSYAKLLVRIVMCAKEAHRLYLEILHRSAFVETLTMFMAVTAQIWKECVTICPSIAQLYDAFSEFYAKYFDANEHERLPSRLSEWLGDDWTENFVVKTQSGATKSYKYQNNIILFNAFDAPSTRQSPSMEISAMDEDSAASCDQLVKTPKFTPKLLINHGMRSISLSEPDKLSRAQQYKSKVHQRVERETEDELSSEIAAERNHKKKMRKLTSETSAIAGGSVSVSDVDMGEKIDRNAFQTQNKIVKLDKLTKFRAADVCRLKTFKDIREFMATEDVLRRKNNPHASQGISNAQWKKVKSSTDQLLILGQERLAVRKFQNLWQNMLKTKQ